MDAFPFDYRMARSLTKVCDHHHSKNVRTVTLAITEALFEYSFNGRESPHKLQFTPLRLLKYHISERQWMNGRLKT
jgi:hypothetical protein